ncbi:MAG: hypothetical protein LUE92_03795 [Clostridiales bacterium]|nr:hypothetical protein [Clostridiales bacterium]
MKEGNDFIPPFSYFLKKGGDNMIRKLIAGFMAVLLMFSAGSSIVMAEDSSDAAIEEENSGSDVQLEDGAYCVPLTILNDVYNGTINTGSTVNDKYQTALVIAKNGESCEPANKKSRGKWEFFK